MFKEARLKMLRRIDVEILTSSVRHSRERGYEAWKFIKSVGLPTAAISTRAPRPVDAAKLKRPKAHPVRRDEILCISLEIALVGAVQLRFEIVRDLDNRLRGTRIPKRRRKTASFRTSSPIQEFARQMFLITIPTGFSGSCGFLSLRGPAYHLHISSVPYKVSCSSAG